MDTHLLVNCLEFKGKNPLAKRRSRPHASSEILMATIAIHLNNFHHEDQ